MTAKKQGAKKQVAGAAADPAKRGRGPKKGAVGAGRPSNAYKAVAAQLLNNPRVKRTLLQVLTDPENRNFASLWKHLDERANGREPFNVDARVKGTLVVKLVREVGGA